MCFYQIGTQVAMFYLTPIVTNVDSDSPTSMEFPTVAICNNNPFRLTYLAAQSILNPSSANPPPIVIGNKNSYMTPYMNSKRLL